MLRIPRAVVEDIVAHAREGRPNEVCGMLVGAREGEGAGGGAGRVEGPREGRGVRRVVRHFRVANVHARPVGEYLLDAKEQLRITLLAEDELGLEVVGFYHSHPAGPPRLSATDAARASWPGASYFLVWLKPAEGYGSWEWDAAKGRFEAETIDVIP
ncbi:MAG: M67 family metallopeptidase [Thermoplasmatota archaeon]